MAAPDPSALAAQAAVACGGQKQLAAALKVDKITVWRWIHGWHRPSWGEMLAMQAIVEAHEKAKDSH